MSIFATVITALVTAMIPTVNFIALLLTLPRRWKLGYTIFAYALVLVLTRMPIILSMETFGIDGNWQAFYVGFAFVPLFLILFCKQPLQITFAYLMQLVFCVFIIRLAGRLVLLFNRDNTDNAFYLLWLIFTLVLSAGYLTLIYKIRKQFFQKLFVDSSPIAWGLYSFGAALSHTFNTFALYIEDRAVSFMAICFSVWCLCVLCYAIINTHEKARHKLSAEYTQDIISSGNRHYGKINMMYNTMRIMRQEYKNYLDTFSDFAETDGKVATEKHLTYMKQKLDDVKFPVYCSNTILNALLASYDEICDDLNIKYSVRISMPEDISVPDFEMCIVLDNLLENAVEMCKEQSEVREIEAAVNTQGSSLAIMVKNSFSSKIIKKDNWLGSIKKDSGPSMRRIQAVASLHGGELMVEQDENIFSAYVLMRI